MNQKGFVNIMLIIIVVALVGAGAYFISTRQVTQPTPGLTPSPTPMPSPTPTPTPTTQTPHSTSLNEITNWKTYRNEKYGFQLLYPPEWKVEQKYESKEWDLMPYSEVVISPDFRELDQTNAEESYDPAPIEKGGRFRITLTAVSHRTSLSWEQFVKEQSYSAAQEINNLKFLYSRFEYPINSTSFSARFLYPFSPTNTTYAFSITLETAKSKEKSYEGIFNSLVSSLRFLK